MKRFTLLIIRKWYSSPTVNFDLGTCITRSVSDFILIRSQYVHNFTDSEAWRCDGGGRGHLLPLAYMLRICLLCKGPEKDNGLPVAEKWNIVTQNTQKDDSRCSESALWQRSDRMTLLPCAGKQLPFSSCDFLHNLPNSFLACCVDECVVLCWAPYTLPDIYTAEWNCSLLIKSITQSYSFTSFYCGN